MVAPTSSKNTRAEGPHSRSARIARPTWPSRFTAIAAGLLALAAPYEIGQAADSLATPIAGRQAEALWPIELQLELVALPASSNAGAASIETRAAVVPDGHRSSFTTAVRTPQGQRTFTLWVVPRHHPAGAVELEWDLEVAEATYRGSTVGEYVLHRLQLGPRPPLDEAQLKIARSDIVSTRGRPYTQVVEIGTQRYEIRIFAQSLRG
jgi:hypothetical protein